MPDQPLQPFAPPSALFSQLQLNIAGMPSSGALVAWALYAILAFWALYTLVAFYHWIKYSHASLVALPAIAAHLLVSFALISYALSGQAFFLTQYLP
ncbi:MAG: hypothetical protein Q8O94_00440 [bacterium]|nr:hypothetical protein [bacterium]